jgi:hypothetical protein
MKKLHPTENNSITIGRPIKEICSYCGKEKEPTP